MTDRVLQGFASPKMADRRREISQKGGRAVPKEKRAFALNATLAKEAGRKGGLRRREANDQEIAVLREFADGSVATVPEQASGRTKRKAERLVRLGYWMEIPPLEKDAKSYRVTPAGYAFLASLERLAAE